MLLVEVLIADVTSTRSRLLFSYIPALPFIVGFAQSPKARIQDIEMLT
jgi:hypothetical protein